MWRCPLTDKRKTMSFFKIAMNCIVFKAFPICEKKKLNKFLEYYTRTYNNYYSNNFRRIKNLSIGRITSLEDYENKRKGIVNCNKNPSIVYRIINLIKQYIRSGYSGESPAWRLSKYMARSFGNSKKKLTNFHLDLRALKDRKKKVWEIFEFQPLYIFDNESYAKIIEQFFTIFHNRAKNKKGYDLSINNFYNPIIGDAIELAKKGTLKRELNPTWKDIKPSDLSTAIKESSTIKIIEKKLNISHKTILRKIDAFGFILNKGKTGLRDARAFFIKPLIEAAVKRDLSKKKCVKLCFKAGITFFHGYSLKIEQINIFCDYIWHNKFKIFKIYSRHKFVNITYSRVRKFIITMEALKIMENPLINTLKKAILELNSRGVVIRYEKELSDILTWTLGLGYTQYQDRILKFKFKKFLKQTNPILSLSGIAMKFNIKPISQNLVSLRHKIYNLFECDSLDIIRKDIWKNTSIFDIFNDKRDDIITYVCKSILILYGLYNYAKVHSIFMGSELAQYLTIPRRTISTHISENLLPLRIIKLVEQRGNYKLYRLTKKSEKFFKQIFYEGNKSI